MGCVWGTCKYWFLFKAAVCGGTDALKQEVHNGVVRISSWDIPLIAWPNVARPKIEGPINTCLAAATKPRDLRHTPMLGGPDNHRALQGQLVSVGIGRWRSIFSSWRSLVQTLCNDLQCPRRKSIALSSIRHSDTC